LAIFLGYLELREPKMMLRRKGNHWGQNSNWEFSNPVLHLWG